MQAVIFDFGGVLVNWDAWPLYQTIFKTREEFDHFLMESRFYECLDRSDRGEPFSDLLKEMHVYAPSCVEHASIFTTRFMETILGVNAGTALLIEELKNLDIPLYGLTNWSAETFPQTRNSFPVFQSFNDIIVSGVEKIAKPDLAIYELAIQRWNLSASKTLFIDDRLENVDAAKRVGICGIHFENSDKLRNDLEIYFPKLKNQTGVSHA